VSRFDHCAITFVDFDRRVGAVAAWIGRRTRRGDRVAPSGQFFIRRVAAKTALVGRRIPIFQLILV
jgi:hypothetical protein